MSLFKRISVVVAAIVLFSLVVTLSPIVVSAESERAVIQSDKYPMSYISPDGSTTIEITRERHYKANCFVAHIITSDPHLLRTCFGNDDVNGREKMTKAARKHDAVFMVNADWSGCFYVSNFVIRNGEVVKPGIDQYACGTYFCIMDNGHMKFLKSHTPLKKAVKAGVWQSFTFSTHNLIRDGKPHAEIGTRAPRTFIGEVPRDDGLLEYYIVVADGRSKESAGLHHLHEAKILCSYGCTIGYNLDGGGSSEMVFDGKILNVPSDGHERRDHDFIYVKLGD